MDVYRFVFSIKTNIELFQRNFCFKYLWPEEFDERNAFALVHVGLSELFVVAF